MKFQFNNKTLEVIPCESFFSKFFGLMFSRKKNLLFIFKKPSKPLIHMLFVFYPIKIYYLDKNKTILDKIVAKPFRIYKTRFDTKYVLEIAKQPL